MRTAGHVLHHRRHQAAGAAGPAGADGAAFCRALPHLAGVVAIPSQVFYDHREQGAPYVRFAFCKRPEVLTDAAARLKALAAR